MGVDWIFLRCGKMCDYTHISKLRGVIQTQSANTVTNCAVEYKFTSWDCHRRVDDVQIFSIHQHSAPLIFSSDGEFQFHYNLHCSKCVCDILIILFSIGFFYCSNSQRKPDIWSKDFAVNRRYEISFFRILWLSIRAC